MQVPLSTTGNTHLHMLWTRTVGVGASSGYLSTLYSSLSIVTRINTGTCEIEHRARCSRFDFTMPSWNSPFGLGGREVGRVAFSVEAPIHRVSASVDPERPIRPGKASRVLCPLRSGASESRAKGRSATRSDSQRPHRRTRWDGHPAWGSLPRPCLALPGATLGGRLEKNGGLPAPTSESPCVGRPPSHD